MLEDLRSPCTEEVAVFHAFSRIVSEARSAFVVLDTAPTGHSLLLMDATGAYHRQMVREFAGHGAARVVTPLMRLQDADYTRIILVTLPEVTPVSQAAALQDDLRRAQIEPYAWVLNKSVLAAGTRDPLLSARLAGERRQIRTHVGRSGHNVCSPCPGSPGRRSGRLNCRNWFSVRRKRRRTSTETPPRQNCVACGCAVARCLAHAAVRWRACRCAGAGPHARGRSGWPCRAA